jgi:hypothetical protein
VLEFNEEAMRRMRNAQVELDRRIAALQSLQ